MDERTPARYADHVIAGVVAAVYVGEVALGGHAQRLGVAGVVLGAALGGSLVVRRKSPVVPLLAGFLVIVLDNVVLRGLAETGAFLVGFVIALYSAGRHGRGWVMAASLVLTAGAIPLAAFEPGERVGFGDVVFFVVFFGGPFMAGRIMRYASEREHALLRRSATLERERDEKARRAVADERLRIARELHDVVAHAISVIVLQARGGRRALQCELGDAREAFDTIEHAGEQALAEMRRLLGMLRTEDRELMLAPQPSLSRIGELASRLTATGLPVEVTVEGEPVELPPGIDVSAFRIVQEALTNALKHAGPARAHVVVRYLADELELEVLDDGAGAAMGRSPGHGLAGIRERVGLYGGELRSGDRPGGGYAVHARLPLGSAR